MYTINKILGLQNGYLLKGHFVVIVLFCLTASSCKKYLDLKPNKAQVIPSSLQDVQAILDNPNQISSSPYEGESAADNYYLTTTTWNSLTRLSDRQTYIWDPNDQLFISSWYNPYQCIFYANQALETLSSITPQGVAESTQWSNLRGTALFYRAFYFYQLAQVFAPVYDSTNASAKLGIPLRLTADVNDVSTRATVQQTYERILQDLNEAVSLLPATTIIQTRPNKAAAYAALARVYLSMGDYTHAGASANASLQAYNVLLDYNQLNAAATYPISRFNKEVLFASTTASALALLSIRAKVDSNLFKSYDSLDLRKKIFFQKNADGSYSFKGSYDGSNSLTPFTGLATDEMYLVRAECYARAGNTANALSDLNSLMQTRWKSGTFIPFSAASADAALSLILTERRKELLFRALRWTDLRRLNKEPRFAVTLTRVVNNQTYTLPPNDLRYTFLIPDAVLARADMPQNPR